MRLTGFLVSKIDTFRRPRVLSKLTHQEEAGQQGAGGGWRLLAQRLITDKKSSILYDVLNTHSAHRPGSDCRRKCGPSISSMEQDSK